MIYVTGTTKRPVPLEHSLYYFGEFFPIARERIIPEARCDLPVPPTLLSGSQAQGRGAHPPLGWQ